MLGVRILKSKSLAETYRFIAMYGNVYELAGRGRRSYLTNSINLQIAKLVSGFSYRTLVDVGCGDGSLVRLLSSHSNAEGSKLIGLLPSAEEVFKVNEYLHKNSSRAQSQSLEIRRGSAESTGLEPSCCDVLICNSVLHGAGQNLTSVKAALSEFYRITKPGSLVFIGELSEANELGDRNYDDSILSWLAWTYRTRGIKRFVSECIGVLSCLCCGKPLIIQPKSMFFMSPVEFSNLLTLFGFNVKRVWRHVDSEGAEAAEKSPRRWNYLAERI